MKTLKSLIIKKTFLAPVLFVLFSFFFIGQVSARPMFGSSSGCGSCVGGARYCADYLFVFWIRISNGGHAEAC